jgi:tetratricopeptide (TPR) repeat protein
MLSKKIILMSLIVFEIATCSFCAIVEAKPQKPSPTIITQSTFQTAEVYFAAGVKKYNKKDYQGALADFNRTIELAPNVSQPYNNRGLLRAEVIKDYRGALADYNRAIQIDPNFANAYNNRGILQSTRFQDNQKALNDFNRAIQLNIDYANAYGNRGQLKYAFLKDRTGGFLDIQKAARLHKKQGNINKYREMVEILNKWRQSDKKSQQVRL